MSDKPAWFEACIIGAVFVTILLPASASLGFFSFLLNVVGIALFVVPIVASVKGIEFN